MRKSLWPNESESLTSRQLSSSFGPGVLIVFVLRGIKSRLTLSLPKSNLESINVVLTFTFVDETLVCDHSNKSY